MAQKERKLFVLFLFSTLFVIFGSFMPQQFGHASYQRSCLEWKDIKYCAHCINSPQDINAPFQPTFGEYNASLVLAINKCKPFSCKQALQLVDLDQQYLNLETSKQVDSILRELDAVSISNKYIPRAKSYIGYTRSYLNQDVQIPTVAYETSSIKEFNHKVTGILLVIFITIFAYVNLALKNFSANINKTLIALALGMLLYGSIGYENLPLQIVFYSGFLSYLALELRYSVTSVVSIFFSFLVLESLKVNSLVNEQFANLSLIIMIIGAVIQIIGEDLKNFGKTELITVTVLIIYSCLHLIWLKTKQNQYLMSEIVIVFAYLSLMQVYLIDNIKFEVFPQQPLPVVRPPVTHIHEFEEVEQELEDNSVM